MSKDDRPKGQLLAIDWETTSASPTQPAFVTRPAGAPVYRSAVLDEVCADGFTLGAITDFEAETCETGDALVVAPGWKSCRTCVGGFYKEGVRADPALRARSLGCLGRFISLSHEKPGQRSKQSDRCSA